MKNWLKVLLSFTGLLLLAFILLYVSTKFIVRPKIIALETSYVQQNVTQGISDINNNIQLIKSNAISYAQWTDTYNYTTNHNQEYINENMNYQSLHAAGADLVILTNTQDQVINSESLNPNGTVNQSVPADLLSAFSGHSQFLAVNDSSDFNGLISLKTGIVLFDSEPILNSYEQGPYRGTFTYGVILDSAGMAEFDNQYKLSLQIFSLNGSNLPTSLLAVKSELNTKSMVAAQLPNNEVAGYQLINDAYGHPALVVGVDVSSKLFVQTNQNLNIYLIVAGVIALSFSILNSLTYNRLFRKQATIDLKDEFFSVASHELRTPLTAIRGNSSMAISMFSKVDTNLTEMLSDIHTASVRLIRLVNNYLDAARLDKGKIPYIYKAVDLNETIKQVIVVINYLALEKGLSLKYTVPDNLPNAYADQDRVKQIIDNLLGNAIKYTDRGSITVSAKVQEGMVVISVHDTGRCMSPRDQKTLFNRFQQLRPEDATKGSGLGLYISKRLVEDMGGKIWVESSSPAIGTTINFSLQVYTPDKPLS